MADPSDKKGDEKGRIPTLHELVTPGKITPHRRQSPRHEQDELHARVEEIVKRHLEREREAIVRRVLDELRDTDRDTNK